MKLDHHEEIFRKTLQQQHVPLDTRNLWSQIEPHIESEKEDRKPFFIWWIFGGLSVVALIAATLFLINWDATPIQHEKSIATASDIKSSTRDLKNPITSQEVKAPAANLSNSQKHEEKPLINSTVSIASTDSPTPIPIKKKSNNSTIKLETNRASGTIQESTSSHSVKKSKTKSVLSSSTEATQEINNFNNSDTKSDIIPTYIAPIESSDEQPDMIRSKHAINKLDPRARKFLSVAHLNALQIPALASTTVSQPAEISLTTLPIKKSREPRWSMYAEVGYGGYSLKDQQADVVDIGVVSSLTLKGLSVNRRFQNIELGVDFRVNKSFSIQTGISYSRFIERSQVNNVYEVAIISNNREDTYFFNDTVEALNAVATVYHSFNHIDATVNNNFYRHFIDIPLTLDYHLNIGKKWQLGLSAGILANIHARSTGAYIDASNRLISLDQLEKSSIGTFNNSKTTINYQGGLKVGYQLSPRMQLYIHPSARYIRNFPRSTLDNSNAVWASGANIGISVKFN